MSRKPKYLSESQFRGKERGSSRGVSPGRRGPDEIEFDMDPRAVNLAKEAFDILDVDHGGSISKEELGAALSALNLDKMDVAYKMLNGLESLGDAVDFDMFLAHINGKKGNQKTKAGIQKIFELVDDGTGKITVQSLAKITADLGENMSEEQLKDCIGKVSGGKDYITPDEFFLIMSK